MESSGTHHSHAGDGDDDEQVARDAQSHDDPEIAVVDGASQSHQAPDL